MAGKPRMLIVGPAEDETVDHSWEAGSAPNVCDYDVVVLCFGREPSEDEWSGIKEQADGVDTYLSNGGRFVLLIDTRRAEPIPEAPRSELPGDSPLDVGLTFRQSCTVEVADDELIEKLDGYAEEVQPCEWFISTLGCFTEIQLPMGERGAWGPDTSSRSLFTNHGGQRLAVALSLGKRLYAGGRAVVHEDNVLVVPKPAELSFCAAAKMLLAALGMMGEDEEASSEEPAWADEVFAPGEGAARARIDEISGQMHQLSAEAKEKREELIPLRRFAALAWATGDELEQLVTAVFQDLFAESTIEVEPKGGSAEADVHLVAGAVTAVVECKGREGVIRQGDYADALKWSTAVGGTGIDACGVLLGNGHRREPPLSRAPTFDPMALAQASVAKICCVSALQLHGAWCAVKLGDAQPQEVFEALVSTAGKIDLKKHPFFDYKAVQSKLTQ